MSGAGFLTQLPLPNRAAFRMIDGVNMPKAKLLEEPAGRITHWRLVCQGEVADSWLLEVGPFIKLRSCAEHVARHFRQWSRIPARGAIAVDRDE